MIDKALLKAFLGRLAQKVTACRVQHVLWGLTPIGGQTNERIKGFPFKRYDCFIQLLSLRELLIRRLVRAGLSRSIKLNCGKKLRRAPFSGEQVRG